MKIINQTSACYAADEIQLYCLGLLTIKDILYRVLSKTLFHKQRHISRNISIFIFSIPKILVNCINILNYFIDWGIAFVKRISQPHSILSMIPFHNQEERGNSYNKVLYMAILIDIWLLTTVCK